MNIQINNRAAARFIGDSPQPPQNSLNNPLPLSQALILHTIPSIAEEASGPSYSVRRLCESLSQQGEPLALLALGDSTLTESPAFLKLFPWGFGPRRLGRAPAMLDWLNTQAQAHRVRLLHNHSLWMMPNVYPGWVARQHGLPLVVSPRGTLSPHAFQSGSLVKKAFWPWVQQPALQATGVFHATSQAEYEDIRRMGFRQPVALIPNGVDLPTLQPKPANSQRTLLFLGRIHPIKGVDSLLKAWGRLEKQFPDWCLQIAGPDNRGHLADMRRLADALHLRRVAFTGGVYGADKWRAFQAADLYVLPSYSENFGMSVAEALASATPAISTVATPWQGLPAHRAGWCIATGPEALSDSLQTAMSLSREELAAMGRRGRAWMADEFAWGQIAQQMAQTYQWLTAGGAAPPWVSLD